MTEMLDIRREKDKMRKLINGGCKEGPNPDTGVKNMVKLMCQYLGETSTQADGVDTESEKDFYDEILVDEKQYLSEIPDS